MATYIAHFKLWDTFWQVEVETLSMVTSGFWINEDYEYTQGADALYWIPYHNVSWVKKINIPLDE